MKYRRAIFQICKTWVNTILLNLITIFSVATFTFEKICVFIHYLPFSLGVVSRTQQVQVFNHIDIMLHIISTAV